MTLIIGIKYGRGIILAGDSQITYGTSKRTDGAKIGPAKFMNTTVLIAQSGCIETSGRFFSIFEERAKELSVESEEDIGRTARLAMTQLRQELRASNGNCSATELNEIINAQSMQCEVMIGFFIGGEPCLYTIGLTFCVARKVTAKFEALGCGAPLGLHLLSEHLPDEMAHWDFGALMAIYVVEIVKRHDAFCGGPTRVSLIRDNSYWWVAKGHEAEVVIYDDRKIGELAALAMAVDSETKGQRAKILKDEFYRRAAAVFGQEITENPPSE